MNYGYARVSSKDQNEGRQIVALEKAGISLQKIYIDKQSGKNFKRPNYIKMLRKLKSNDVYLLKVLIDLAKIMMKYWNNGKY